MSNPPTIHNDASQAAHRSLNDSGDGRLPFGRIELLNEEGLVAQQWIIQTQQCTIGTSSKATVQCAMPKTFRIDNDRGESGLQAVHATVIFGRRHTLIKCPSGEMTVGRRRCSQWLIDEPATIALGSLRFVLYPTAYVHSHTTGFQPSAGTIQDATARLASSRKKIDDTEAIAATGATKSPDATNEQAEVVAFDEDAFRQSIHRETLDAIANSVDPIREMLEQMDDRWQAYVQKSQAAAVVLESENVESESQSPADVDTVDYKAVELAGLREHFDLQITLLQSRSSQVDASLEAINDRIARNVTVQTDTLQSLAEEIRGQFRQMDDRIACLSPHNSDAFESGLHQLRGEIEAIQTQLTAVTASNHQPSIDSRQEWDEPAELPIDASQYDVSKYDVSQYENEQNIADEADSPALSESIASQDYSAEALQADPIELDAEFESSEDQRDADWLREQSFQFPLPADEESVLPSESYYYSNTDFAGAVDASDEPSAFNQQSSQFNDLNDDSHANLVDDDVDQFAANDDDASIEDVDYQSGLDSEPIYRRTEPVADETSSYELSEAESFASYQPNESVDYSGSEYNTPEVPDYEQAAQQPSNGLPSWFTDTSSFQDFSTEREGSIAEQEENLLESESVYGESQLEDLASESTSEVHSDAYDASVQSEVDADLAESEQNAAAEVLVADPDSIIAEDEEESVEAYMQRLLQRVKGGDTTKALPPKPAAPSPAYQSSAVAVPKLEALEAEEDQQLAAKPELDMQNFQPRSSAPENNVSLAAMRDLANESARKAIAKSGSSKVPGPSSTHGKSIVSAFGFLIGTVILVLNGLAINISFIGMVAAYLIFLIWGFEATQGTKFTETKSSAKKTQA